MNWKERIKPSNSAEVGCLIILVAIPFSVAAIILDLNYIPHFAMGAWLIVYAFRYGLQAHAAYEVPKRTAIIVSGVLIFVYFLIWLGILVALIFTFSNIISQVNSWLFFIFGIALAGALHFHMERFKQSVYEKWFGWQPKEGIIE